MRVGRVVRVMLAATVGVGCSDPTPADRPTTADVTVLNASPWTIQVETDRAVTIPEVDASKVSPDFEVTGGLHEIGAVSFEGALRIARASFVLDPSMHYNIVAYSPGGDTLRSRVLPHDDAAVPAGKAKLRVLHLAPNAPPVDIWYSTNGGTLFITVTNPFAFSAVPSPYVLNESGSWIVQVSEDGNPTNVLATTGPFAMPDGARRTVALVDSAGLLRLRVLIE